MSNAIITVEGLGKRYLLGATLANDTLRDQIAHAVGSVGRMFRVKGASPAESKRSGPEELWALRDVSFEVAPGEVVGIIGRNGAGKSTLLKILSQITDPTEGELRVRGRLASLLEVGTGFHQELSGRENIFLNGAILGMSQAEIRRKFDEIVAFAEVEKFLDTPVKRYSSGMYVRLAFAVAAHLEPEILVVDEVLAVGDAAFQNKCLGKMEEVARSRGRTVLFVSHNMSAVQFLCGRAILLSQGRVKGIGLVEDQVRAYLGELKQTSAQGAELRLPLGRAMELRRLSFTPNPVTSGSEVTFSVEIMPQTNTRLVDLHVHLFSVYGARVAIIDLRLPNGQPHVLEAGKLLSIQGSIRALPLVGGDYRVGLFVKCGEYYQDFFDLTAISVADRETTQGNPPYKAVHRGLIELETEFEVK